MFREAIEKMAAYKPGEQPRPGERLIKLNTNENPYPPSPRVRRAIAHAAADGLRLYPAPRGDAFVASAAKLYAIREDMILAGNGSDELLAMIFRATLGAGDTVAYPIPTYSLYDTLASIQEARVLGFPVAHDFSLPLDQLAEARAALTIVCSPNSPSGVSTPTAKLAKLARALQGRLLVIDEAYVDFAEENAFALLRRFPNVVVLRTLSKSFSLAGMRLGLCFARPPVIEELMKVKDSYNLSRIALAAGAAALDDSGWMRRNVERVKHTRDLTIARLRKLGFEVPDSSANFVLARMAGHDMASLVRKIREAGILVRYFPTPMLHDAIRISIGTPAEMNALLKAIDANLAVISSASNLNGSAPRARR
ncbi:MAG TPA: histidinol-phosphate transaminase [Candidatus Binataceae bacterium]|nr:histidinol-phosphate transaminase [Candidatus Binataceae bacterium]